jgi:hypothetical protein
MSPNMKRFRVESFISNQPVIAELEVVKDENGLLIVRTFGSFYKRLIKDVDKNGEYYKTVDLSDSEITKWVN